MNIISFINRFAHTDKNRQTDKRTKKETEVRRTIKSVYIGAKIICASAGACGAVVVDNSRCMFTRRDAGHPFDRYVGM